MGDAYSAAMGVISYVCSVKAGVPLFLKHIYSEDCGVVALHTFSDIFDGTESSETKGVWRQVESCIGRFDFFIFASCTTTSQKHVAWVLSLF